MGNSFYTTSDGAVFVPSDFTIGPWSRDAQHGGPPAALLGRAIDRAAGDGKQLVRLVFDILRPVPIRPLLVETNVIRPGNKVCLVEGRLRSGGDVVMRASAWAMRAAQLELGNAPHEDGPQSPPEDYEPMNPADISSETSYLHATEWRFVTGSFLAPGPGATWIRALMPLVEGEHNSPLVDALIVADSASGVSGALDFRRWLYINTDLSVYLHRLPDGPWIKIDAVTIPEPTGNALTSARLYDRTGPIGTSSQALFIEPR